MSQHPINRRHHDERTFGQRAADGVASGMGSWKFILIQTAVVGAWIVLNVIEFLGRRWDPYPFILLNLLFSTQAAYAAPIIMQSQNRASAKDRDLLEWDHTLSMQHSKSLSLLEQLLDENTKLTREIRVLSAVQHKAPLLEDGQVNP